MKQVWKCDHCSETGTLEKIKNHELTCSFNPIMRLCWTCKNRVDEGAPISGFWNKCIKGKNCTEVEESEKPCNLWELKI